ncbi:hypothetical protein QBC40DRAFT_325911 [Triangularia verruculosa]|uniref:Dihydrodipicolinate synthase n=1 Tax=Triangularia verruculosa TaxID=2587418 RepID=A0AAN6XLR2_9PEZI|nr:hypothetical protein QBC40DRAFT_325911 [Triangularia verruculosa]
MAATTASVPPPPSGLWVPSITIFSPSDTLDLESQSKYFQYLSTPSTGLSGLLVLGTNAEPFLLTREERSSLLHLARSVCPPRFPIMAGVSGHSTAQVKEFISDAQSAGADYVLVLPCAYFGAKPSIIEGFFRKVSQYARELGREKGREMGVVIYNFPGVTNGTDLDSATIARIVRQNDNVVGVKLTCGSVAKMTRLAAEFGQERFKVFGGQSDFLIGGLSVGGAGCVAAFGNVFPKVIGRVYRLWEEGRREEALELHRLASLGEQVVKGWGVAGTKLAAGVYTGVKAGVVRGDLEGVEEMFKMRSPYESLGSGVREVLMDGLKGLEEVEGGL